jgi:hypothetical protein
VAERDRFRVNEPGVVCEVFPDGETVIVNLLSGVYFSASGVGTVVWDLLRGGFDESGIVAGVARRCTVSPAEIAPAVHDFIQELEREGLIVRSADEEAGHPRVDLSAGGETGGGPLPYEAPVLSRYADMKDLLVLDPIHEVDAAGWPARRRGSTPS